MACGRHRYTSGTEAGGAQGDEGIVRPRFPPDTVRMVPAWPAGLSEPLAADALMIWTFLRVRDMLLVQQQSCTGFLPDRRPRQMSVD